MSLRRRPPVLPAVIRVVAFGVITAILCDRASSADSEDQVIQAIADVTVIDAACRTTNTMYGAVFRYGENHGVRENDILISGKRRQEFEAAMNRRLRMTPREEICGSMLARYWEAFPDWFRSR